MQDVNLPSMPTLLLLEKIYTLKLKLFFIKISQVV
jgi:hypothetical protein